MIKPTVGFGSMLRASARSLRSLAGPLFLLLFTTALAAGAFAPALFAQPAATGQIEGRVQNAITGDYLYNARVSVKGTNLVAQTDDAGYYRLNGVPAGTVHLRVFFTGMDEQEATVTVVAGQAQAADFKLASVARYGKDAGTVTLD